MFQTKIIALVVILTAGTVVPLYSQVDKPRAEPTGRLPAPAKVTSVQDTASGFIRVMWTRVDGAERYSVTRSVPPAAATTLSLPNPSDTFYIDRDVKTGSTYYYLVGAINEAGITGLKASAPPIRAEDLRAPLPPGSVGAVIQNKTANITWWSPQHSTESYMIDRSEVTDSGPPRWQSVFRNFRCCHAADNLASYAPGTRLQYRVITMSSRGVLSTPALSNEITTPAATSGDTTTGQNPPEPAPARTVVLPAVVAEPGKVRVGGPVLRLGATSTFTGLRLQKPRWVSLDEAVATVTSDGRVRGRSPGFTYVVATGVTPDGAVASMVARIDVAAQ